MKALVYTKPGCQPCKATKRQLAALDANWEEVELTEEKASQFRSQGFLQAPIVEVYDAMDEFGVEELEERWSGFRPDMINDYFQRLTIDDLMKAIGWQR